MPSGHEFGTRQPDRPRPFLTCELNLNDPRHHPAIALRYGVTGYSFGCGTRPDGRDAPIRANHGPRPVWIGVDMAESFKLKRRSFWDRLWRVPHIYRFHIHNGVSHWAALQFCWLLIWAPKPRYKPRLDARPRQHIEPAMPMPEEDALPPDLERDARIEGVWTGLDPTQHD